MKLISLFVSVFVFLSFHSFAGSNEEKASPQSSIQVLNLDDFLSKDENIRQQFIQNIRTSLGEEGFFALKAHQIKDENVEAAYGAAKDFFALPLADKKQYEGIALNRGYKSFNLQRQDKAPDLQEYWHVGRELSAPQEQPIDPNVWPNLSNFKKPMLTLYRNMDETGQVILQAISLAMNENPHFLGSITDQGDSVMRIIHYLDTPTIPNSSLSWKAPHRDPNLLTIISGITDEGLEIQLKNGSWLTIPHDKETVIVSASNMLESLSNGLFRSTPHRVIQKSQGDRYAIPFFIHVKKNVNIGPRDAAIQMTGGKALYPSMTAEESLKVHKWFKSSSHPQ